MRAIRRNEARHHRAVIHAPAILAGEVLPEIAAGQVNYGHLQVLFADGSVGWYEAGWGPMMSDVAFFVKDVVGPQGCVSIVGVQDGSVASDNVEGHTKVARLRLHHGALAADGSFAKADEFIECADEPDHDGLCLLEQQLFLDAIENDRDLYAHMADAVNSLRIVLAAHASFRTGSTVEVTA